MQIAVWIEQVLNNRDFDLGLTGVTPGPDPDPILTDEYDITNGDNEAMKWKNDEVQQLLAQQTGKPFRPPKSKMRQGMLPLEIVSKGRFDKSEPTIHHGEDLDVPTYIRRGVPLN